MQSSQPARITIGMDIDVPDSVSTTTSGSQSITVTTDIKSMNHDYNLNVDDGGDVTPPTSSIDDLIMTSSTSSEASGTSHGNGKYLLDIALSDISLLDKFLLHLEVETYPNLATPNIGRAYQIYFGFHV